MKRRKRKTVVAFSWGAVAVILGILKLCGFISLSWWWILLIGCLSIIAPIVFGIVALAGAGIAMLVAGFIVSIVVYFDQNRSRRR
jgi:hypothetical protein